MPGMVSSRSPGTARSGRDEKRPIGVGVLGRDEDLVAVGVLDHLAGVHHRHVVRRLRDHPEVVGDEQDAHPRLFLQLLDQVEDLRLDRHVERGGRLVGDQERRVAGQRHGDHRALAHAAGQLGAGTRRRASGAGMPTFAASRWRARARRRRRGPVQDGRLMIWFPTVYTGFSAVIGSWKIIAMSLPRISRSRSSSAPMRSSPRKRMEPPSKLARRHRQELEDRERGHALARSRLPHHAEGLARTDRVGHAVHGLGGPSSVWKYVFRPSISSSHSP